MPHYVSVSDIVLDAFLNIIQPNLCSLLFMD